MRTNMEIDDKLIVVDDRALRARGITIRKTIDLLIGTFCIRQRLPLLHRDRDFDAMEQHLGLHVLHA